ncbi:MAG: hypothetical protein U0325_25635 [Polyangiales bacterium]
MDKTDKAAPGQAQLATLPFIKRIVLKYEDLASDIRDRGRAWALQAQLATDEAEKDQYAAIAAAHEALLGKPGTTPVSLNTIAEMLERVRPDFRLRQGPSPAPRNAWIIIGNNDSWIDRQGLDGINADPDYWHWNGSPHTEKDDLLFFYYTAPRGAVCFVARADRDPYYQANASTSADISPGQWWFGLKSMMEIEPITFKELCAICGETLILKGQSGKKLTAAMANALLSRINIKHPPDSDIRTDIMQPVVNHALPQPGAMSLDDLRDLASGHLNLEKDVEEYIVDPLLRLAGLNEAPYRIERQVRVGRGLADRVVYDGDKAVCVIEVKRRLHLDQNSDWATCIDLEQVAGYATRLSSDFMLVDVDRIACFKAGNKDPSVEFDRRFLDEDAIEDIALYASGRGE